MHGHAGEALSINPLSVVVMVFLAISACWLSWDVARGSDTYRRLYKRRWPRTAVLVAVVILLLNWIRNIREGL
jgi:hypothetical protein